VTIAIRPSCGGGMRGPYTRFHLLKKRNIFDDGLEQPDHVETASKNRVLARAIFCSADAAVQAMVFLTPN
jgi:hypothetical protein